MPAPTRHSIRLATLAATALAAAGCTRPGPGVGALPQPADSVVLRWSPLFWARVTTDTLVFPQAAILAMVSLQRDQPPAMLQLDLAASGRLPDGFPRRRSPGEAFRVRRTGQLHGLLSAATAVTRERPDSGPEVLTDREIGTLGFGAFESGGLVLDLPNLRYAPFRSPADLRRAFGPEVEWMDIEVDDGRIFLPIAVGGAPAGRALLDTGLSPFALWTTRALWEDLTGPPLGGRPARRFEFDGRAGPLRFLGAEPRRALEAGARRVRVREVVYLADGPAGAALEEWSPRVAALISPLALAPDRWLILDLKQKKLGFGPRLR